MLKERAKEVFLKHVVRLQSAYNIYATALDYTIRIQVSFFIAIKSFIVKVERDGMPDVEAFKRKISEMIEQAIIRDGDEVVSITAKKEKSLLSVENLQKIMAMKRKNVAAAILKKLIDDKIKWFEQTNIVRSGFFSDKLKVIVERYNQIEDINVLITEMIDIAKEIESAINEGIDLQLSPEEQAFYDALAKPDSRKTVGLDMESYGMFYAALNSTGVKSTALCIKSICDFADTEKGDGFQNYSAYTSAQIARFLYEKIFGF